MRFHILCNTIHSTHDCFSEEIIVVVLVNSTEFVTDRSIRVTGSSDFKPRVCLTIYGNL